jgi:hypothetical protein
MEFMNAEVTTDRRTTSHPIRETMASTRVRFNVGDFQCIAIKDGTFPYTTNSFLANVPNEQLERVDVGALYFAVDES